MKTFRVNALPYLLRRAYERRVHVDTRIRDRIAAMPHGFLFTVDVASRRDAAAAQPVTAAISVGK